MGSGTNEQNPYIVTLLRDTEKWTRDSEGILLVHLLVHAKYPPRCYRIVDKFVKHYIHRV